MAGMEQAKIDEAARQCVRKSLGGNQPRIDLHFLLVELRDNGWIAADLEALKIAAQKMLSAVGE